MKNMSPKIFVLFALISLLVGCAPANNTVGGTWIANVGKINFLQKGNKITGTIEGYGGATKNVFEGTLTDQKAVFNTEWFGAFTLVFDGNTFKSASPDLAFCGIRSDQNTELPSGCGFSGKWTIPAKPGFPAGSYVELKQVEENVTGTFYNGEGKVYDTISGTVYWGKGWMMNGTTEKHGKVRLDMNSAETGFMIVTDDFPADKQLCAVREGQTNVYLMWYYCK